MDVINVAVQQVLAASVNASIGGTQSNSDALSREYDPYWDDEEW